MIKPDFLVTGFIINATVYYMNAFYELKFDIIKRKMTKYGTLYEICKERKLDVQNMTQIALCVTILCISSYLVIPLPFTPIVLSFHTIMVNLIGLILKPKQAGYVIAIYILMGLIGLPVFSAGTAGPGKLFGPTGGFYFGFLFAAIIISKCKGSKNSFLRYLLATIAFGLPIQHICEILMMCFHNNFNIAAAAMTVSLPFIPGDIIKCVIASGLGVAVNKALPRLSHS